MPLVAVDGAGRAVHESLAFPAVMEEAARCLGVRLHRGPPPVDTGVHRRVEDVVEVAREREHLVARDVDGHRSHAGRLQPVPTRRGGEACRAPHLVAEGQGPRNRKGNLSRSPRNQDFLAVEHVPAPLRCRSSCPTYRRPVPRTVPTPTWSAPGRCAFTVRQPTAVPSPRGRPNGPGVPAPARRGHRPGRRAVPLEGAPGISGGDAGVPPRHPGARRSFAGTPSHLRGHAAELLEMI